MIDKGENNKLFCCRKSEYSIRLMARKRGTVRLTWIINMPANLDLSGHKILSLGAQLCISFAFFFRFSRLFFLSSHFILFRP